MSNMLVLKKNIDPLECWKAVEQLVQFTREGENQDTIKL